LPQGFLRTGGRFAAGRQQRQRDDQRRGGGAEPICHLLWSLWERDFAPAGVRAQELPVGVTVFTLLHTASALPAGIGDTTPGTGAGRGTVDDRHPVTRSRDEAR